MAGVGVYHSEKHWTKHGRSVDESKHIIFTRKKNTCTLQLVNSILIILLLYCLVKIKFTVRVIKFTVRVRLYIYIFRK